MVLNSNYVNFIVKLFWQGVVIWRWNLERFNVHSELLGQRMALGFWSSMIWEHIMCAPYCSYTLYSRPPPTTSHICEHTVFSHFTVALLQKPEARSALWDSSKGARRCPCSSISWQYIVIKLTFFMSSMQSFKTSLKLLYIGMVFGFYWEVCWQKHQSSI